MKKVILLGGISLLLGTSCYAQLKVGDNPNTIDANSALEVESTNKGFVPPRIALTDVTLPNPMASAPLPGSIVYSTGSPAGGQGPGLYYWNGSWQFLSDASKAWSLTGNAGTVAGTNFIGTTDAADFVTSTGGIERMRILSGGTAGIGATGTASTAARLTLAGAALNGLNATTTSAAAGNYAAHGSNGTNYDAYLGYVGATTAGNIPVYANVASGGASNFAISGVNNSSATFAAVQGQTTSGSGAGVWAINSAGLGAGAGNGLYASTAQSGGYGVLSANNNAAGSGIYGYNTATAGTLGGSGVVGYTLQSGGNGIRGLNGNAAGIGIFGQNSAASGNSGNGIGIYGTSAQSANGATSNGYGVVALNSNALGTGLYVAGNNLGYNANYIIAGSGASIVGSNIGMFGWANAASGYGIYGSAAGATGYGVVGGGNNLAPIIFTGGAGGAFTGTTTGITGYAANYATGNAGGYFQIAATRYAYVAANIGGTNYKIIGTGTVSTIVDGANDKKAIMFAPEATEILFEDYGEALLVNGKAHINIDPVLSKNIVITDRHPLRAFVQPEGDCKGVYITNKTSAGFDVVELGNGNSNIPFQWHIVCNRADEYVNGSISSKNADLRLPEAPPIKKTTTPQQSLSPNTGVN